MNINITFRHMEKSLDMEQSIHRELKKIDKFLGTQQPITIEMVVTAEAQKGRLHNLDLRVIQPQGLAIAKAEHYQFDQALSEVIHAVIEELKRIKAKRLDGRNDILRDGKEDFEK